MRGTCTINRLNFLTLNTKYMIKLLSQDIYIYYLSSLSNVELFLEQRKIEDGGDEDFDDFQEFLCRLECVERYKTIACDLSFKGLFFKIDEAKEVYDLLFCEPIAGKEVIMDKLYNYLEKEAPDFLVKKLKELGHL